MIKIKWSVAFQSKSVGKMQKQAKEERTNREKAKNPFGIRRHRRSMQTGNEKRIKWPKKKKKIEKMIEEKKGKRLTQK